MSRLIPLVLSLVFISSSAFASPATGPFFHSRSTMNVRNYTQKVEKKVSAMTAAERASLGISFVDGAYYSESGARIPSGREYWLTKPGSSFSAKATAGRYLYTGNVPRFERDQLEIYVSKTALTVRVKGWVDSYLLARYRYQQLYRWKGLYDRFQDPVLSFVPLKDPEVVQEQTKDVRAKAWLDIAIQYMGHALENAHVDLFNTEQSSAAAYKEKILTAMLRTALGNPGLSIADGLRLYAALSTPEARAADAAASRELFMKNLGASFTPDSSRPGYEGFLTFVYPIAGSTKGPFDQPGEGVVRFASGGTFIESRPWSDIWNDEFGGLPFMEVISGVGFHGPITSKAGLDAWYLRRGYVSHGCFRMDTSDVLEMRAMLPASVASMRGKGIPMWITSYPDVTDWNNDGRVEAMDVGYYEIPPEVSPKSVASYLLPAPGQTGPNAQSRYWKAHFLGLNGKLTNPATGEKLSFDLPTGTFRTLPKYGIVKGKLSRIGFHDEVPIYTFPNRRSNVVQYRDSTVSYNSGAYEDIRGSYSPGKLNNLSWVPAPAESRNPPPPPAVVVPPLN